MKVAEIYGELALKLSGDSKANLQEFEKTLLGIANAAKQAVAALAQLSGMKVPRGLQTSSAPQQNQPNPAPAQQPNPAPAQQPNPAPVQQPNPAPRPAPQQNQPNPQVTPGRFPFMFPNGVPVPSNPNFIGPLPQNPTSPSASGGPSQVAHALLFGLKLLGIGTLVLAIKKLVSTIAGWVGASMKAAVSTELFSRQTGLSRKTMLEWELAAQKAGLAEGEAASAMETFTQKWQHMRLTGEGAAPFGMLGIDPSAGPEAIFRRFQERTRNMSQAEATYFGSLLGFSKDFAAFLHTQKGEIRRFNDEVLSNDEQKEVTDLNAAWVEMSTRIGQLRDKIVADLAPTLGEWIKLIGDTALALIKARESIENNVSGMMDVINPSPAQIRVPERHLFTGANPYFGSGSSKGDTNITNHISGVMDPEGVKRAAEQGTQDALRKSTASAYYQRYQPLGGPQPANP